MKLADRGFKLPSACCLLHAEAYLPGDCQLVGRVHHGHLSRALLRVVAATVWSRGSGGSAAASSSSFD